MTRLAFPVLSAAALSAGVLLFGCGDGGTEATPPDPPRPTSVAVTPATTALDALGAMVQLAAEVRDQNGNVMANATVSWSSGDASVAAVDGSGLVAAAGNGTVTITAIAGGASGSATVTVVQQVSAVAVSPAADTLVAGDTLRLAAEATDANGHAVKGAGFVWASSNTAVAAVDEVGLVTGLGPGAATATATTSGVTGEAELTVLAPAPTSVAVAPDTVAFTAIGQTTRLAAEVLDQIVRVMEDVPVSWSSADTMVAAVDSTGLVTAAGSGTTAVTAMAGEVAGEAVVTVMQSVGSVTVSPTADTIAPGDTLRIVAEAYDDNGHRVDGAQFTWSSSDASVATVDASGLVEGVAEGMATITATAGDARATSEITVENPDRAALVALYEATDGPNWVNNDNWLTEAPLREWYGVGWEWHDGEERVERLLLYDNNLSGPIPDAISRLDRITTLHLDGNHITGPIPTAITELV